MASKGYVLILDSKNEDGKDNPMVMSVATLDFAKERLREKIEAGAAQNGYIFLVDLDPSPVGVWPVGKLTTEGWVGYESGQDWNYPNFLVNGYLVTQARKVISEQPALMILAALGDFDAYKAAYDVYLAPGYATSDELEDFARRNIIPTRFGDTYPTGATTEQVEAVDKAYEESKGKAEAQPKPQVQRDTYGLDALLAALNKAS